MNSQHRYAALFALSILITACTGASGPDNNSGGNGGSNASNTSPTVDAGDPQTVVEGNDITLNGDANDSDGSIASYLWQQISGPSIDELRNANTANVSFTAPSVSSNQEAVLRLTVTDNDGASASDDVTVTITNNLAAPSVSAGSDRSHPENTVGVELNANAVDDDGSVVSYQWQQVGGSDITINNANSADANFDAPEVSEDTNYTFRVTVTDNDGNSASDSVDITITNTLIAPTADAGPDQNPVSEGDTINLDGSGSSDSNGTIDRYQWAQVGGSELSISNADSASPTGASFVAPTTGTNITYTIELTVTDNDGQTATDQVEITVIGDLDAPIANAGSDQENLVEPAPADPALVVTLDGSASSPGTGATIINYSWVLNSVLPAGSENITLNDATIAGPSFTVPDIHRQTTYEFTLTITDSNGDSANDTVSIVVDKYLEARNRYQHHNQCFVMYAHNNEMYIEGDNTGYTATALEPEDAAKFWMRPAGLGKYIFYNKDRELLGNTGNPISGDALGTTALEDADELSAVFTLTGAGDSTQYPEAPQFHVEPNDGQLGVAPGTGTIAKYRDFMLADPNTPYSAFNIAIGTSQLALDGSDLSLAAASGADSQQFYFESFAGGCPDFPEATSNTSGETYSGTVEYTDAAGEVRDIVIGHADTHVHVSSNNFLGMTQWGRTVHPLGAHHALDDCDEFHGSDGQLDTVGTLFGIDPANPNPTHDTTGFPTFPQWPARGELTHEAIYWGWLERSWKAGLRIVVNDLVDNETLCELQRPSSPDPLQDCNAMNNAGKQVGTMYAMQDYIDAMYGGRGEGFFQIVTSHGEAREVIADGKIAVVLGIEISNFLDCKVVYRPTRQQEPYQEDGSSIGENEWTCTMTGDPTADNHVDRQLERLWNLGVRQIISIHEFDNALGGNGIFDSLVLNAGNRENSGGIPVGGFDLAAGVTGGLLTDPFAANPPDPANPLGDGSGEFWTTYDCPQTSDSGTDFRGYFSGGGEAMLSACQGPEEFRSLLYSGQNGRPGGSLPCYPEARQCNARLMTPIGLYVYKKMMEMGFVIDWDHMEIGMKTQMLMLAEAQNPPYPFVSTHGSFGGTTKDQIERLYANGGHVFPSLGGARGFRNKVVDTKPVWDAASSSPHRVNIFGLGYGTDTNGLSGQAGPRGGNDRLVSYPFELYGGHDFFSDSQISDLFQGSSTVSFEQPCVLDPALAGDGVSDCAAHVGTNPSHGRTWNIDVDGSAHYGMSADFVEELNLETAHPTDGDSYKDSLEALFLSAEVFLRTWEKTQKASEEIAKNDNGGKTKEPGFDILRPAARRPGGGGPDGFPTLEDMNDPSENHFDAWGTIDDPYPPAQP